MGLWLVDSDYCGYDEFDSFIIRCSTKQQAEDIAKQKANTKQKWKAERITISGEDGIIHESFQAG